MNRAGQVSILLVLLALAVGAGAWFLFTGPAVGEATRACQWVDASSPCPDGTVQKSWGGRNTAQRFQGYSRIGGKLTPQYKEQKYCCAEQQPACGNGRFDRGEECDSSAGVNCARGQCVDCKCPFPVVVQKPQEPVDYGVQQVPSRSVAPVSQYSQTYDVAKTGVPTSQQTYAGGYAAGASTPSATSGPAIGGALVPGGRGVVPSGSGALYRQSEGAAIPPAMQAYREQAIQQYFQYEQWVPYAPTQPGAGSAAAQAAALSQQAGRLVPGSYAASGVGSGVMQQQPSGFSGGYGPGGQYLSASPIRGRAVQLPAALGGAEIDLIGWLGVLLLLIIDIQLWYIYKSVRR